MGGSGLISAGGLLRVGGASSSINVNFAAASTGTLRLDHALNYTGHVGGLTPTTKIDLSDIAFSATNTHATYAGDATGGTLTGRRRDPHGAACAGREYLGLVWSASSDGHGGTFVVDPPVISSNENSGNSTISDGAQLELAAGVIGKHPVCRPERHAQA